MHCFEIFTVHMDNNNTHRNDLKAFCSLAAISSDDAPTEVNEDVVAMMRGLVSLQRQK